MAGESPLWQKLGGADSPGSIISVNTDNATVIKNSPGVLSGLIITNTATTIRRVKLYDKSTTPTAADTPKLRLEIPPADSAGKAGGLAWALRARFVNGIGIRIVTEQADAGTTAPAAGDVVVNYTFK